MQREQRGPDPLWVMETIGRMPSNLRTSMLMELVGRHPRLVWLAMRTVLENPSPGEEPFHERGQGDDEHERGVEDDPYRRVQRLDRESAQVRREERLTLDDGSEWVRVRPKGR